MIDPFIIERIEEERRKRLKDNRIPLYIHPPDSDGGKERPKRPEDTNKKGYIEIDIAGTDKDDDPNVIKM
jgi:hypothetical protein